MPKIILASKSKVTKKILDENDILNDVKPSNVDEDIVKLSLLKEKATPEIISKVVKPTCVVPQYTYFSAGISTSNKR